MIRSIRRDHRGPTVCALWLTMLLFVVSCSASRSDNSDGPYASEIREAAQHATSDFERQVLSDGVITEEEYQEALQRYVDCAKAKGVDIGLIDNGGWYTYSMVQTPGADAIELACNRGTIMIIGGLYEQIVKNPNREDIDAVEYRCLARLGVAPSGYTLEQYKKDKATERSPGGSNSNPYPFDNTSALYAACIDSPASPKTN